MGRPRPLQPPSPQDRSAAGCDYKLDHIHEMLHLLAHTQRSQSKVLAGIAAAVHKLSPGVDPELAEALAESAVIHEQLKAELDKAKPEA